MEAKIQVTRFANFSNNPNGDVTDDVNEFLKMRGYLLEEVQIQFVTSVAPWPNGEWYYYEAYITHPIDATVRGDRYRQARR